MNIICISDTHNKHRLLDIPYGEVLVHTGDFTEGGTRREVLDFFEWFAQQPHLHKICIAGNHEFYLEKHDNAQLAKIIPPNVHYLFQSSINIKGVKFWGSPFSPLHKRWAFSKNNNAMAEHWKEIPQDTDVLLTHTPPYNILDESEAEVALGCEHLRKRVEKIQPRFHIFGHLHNNYGKINRNKITFVNATSFNKNSLLINPPIKLEYLP